MPNELIRPTGSYKVSKRYRRVEKRRGDSLHDTNVRIHGPPKKKTLARYIKIIGLYLTLYVCIAILLACNILILYNLRVPNNEPLERKCTSMSSVPGNFVGDRKIIRFQADQRNQITPYIRHMYAYVKKYGNEGKRRLRGCNLDNNWGYNSGLPCILLKLNNAIGFKAETYTSSLTLPKEVPNELHDYILQLPLDERIDRIWVSCSFLDNATDAKVDYIPHRYYDADGLFEKENFYLRTISENLTAENIRENPAFRRVIGVQFQYLPMNRDVTIKCTAWAENIPVDVGSIIIIFRIEGHEVFPNPDPDFEEALDLNFN
ncbi:sodium/potassium-transporting ATPase subunit beta-1 [Drosophila montana]|uniref:sodium/potassium-transporting ATPase subunit beta-1 n=1 Tax=Drosophila montana TaxID=40370 RepID=UPI00313EFDD5